MEEVNGIVWVLYHEDILNHNVGEYLIIVEVQLYIAFLYILKCGRMSQLR